MAGVGLRAGDPPRSLAGEVVRTLAVAIVLVVAVQTFLYQPFRIPSGSMRQTLEPGDYVLVSKFAYGYSRWSFPFGWPAFGGRILGTTPARGDVVVFKLPRDPSVDYVKRVIGLPGEVVTVTGAELSVNGEPAMYAPAGEGPAGSRRFVETLPGGRSHPILRFSSGTPRERRFEVPAGHLFVMGDDRDNSTDSRDPEVGFVPIENVVGRAELIFFSVGADGGSGWGAVRWSRMWTTIE